MLVLQFLNSPADCEATIPLGDLELSRTECIPCSQRPLSGIDSSLCAGIRSEFLLLESA